MSWYQRRWWYIERPFPWPLWLVVAIVLAALVVGVLLAC